MMGHNHLMNFKKSLQPRQDGYLNPCDFQYLSSYAIEHVTDLFSREMFNHYENLMNHGDEFEIKFGSRKTRAYLIDQLFGVASKPEMQMSDKSVIFQAISLFDRYYNETRANYDEIKSQPSDKRLRSINDIRTYDDFIKIDLLDLSERDIRQLRQGSYTDLIAVGYTCFFIASKNQEVSPISLNDITRTLLRGHNI